MHFVLRCFPHFLLLHGFVLGAPLRPTGVPALPLFLNWVANRTVEVLGSRRSVQVAEGRIKYSPPMEDRFGSDVTLLPGLLSRDEVAALLSLLNSSRGPSWDTDPDSIDGMSTFELYLRDNEMAKGGGQKEPNSLKGDADPREFAARRPLREAVNKLLDPILDERVIPFVRHRLHTVCNASPERACRVCSSVVRKYGPST
jgi:hypothetical protein